MFTILYFLVRIILYKPAEEYEFSEIILDLIIDPITIVFAVLMIAAIVATCIKKKDKVEEKIFKGISMGIILYIILAAVLATWNNLEVSCVDLISISAIYLGIAICIFSIVFIIKSILNGRGVVNGLIDMFDFEMKGILWIIIAFGCLMIILLPIFFFLMLGFRSGSGNNSDDDDDFWWWYLLMR